MKWMLWMMAVAAWPGSALFAQSITGAWQGTLTLPNGRDLRIVVKISTTDADNLKGVFYSIDQPGPGVSPPINSGRRWFRNCWPIASS
jgi:hypothetical protein